MIERDEKAPEQGINYIPGPTIIGTPSKLFSQRGPITLRQPGGLARPLEGGDNVERHTPFKGPSERGTPAQGEQQDDITDIIGQAPEQREISPGEEILQRFRETNNLAHIDEYSLGEIYEALKISVLDYSLGREAEFDKFLDYIRNEMENNGVIRSKTYVVVDSIDGDDNDVTLSVEHHTSREGTKKSNKIQIEGANTYVDDLVGENEIYDTFVQYLFDTEDDTKDILLIFENAFQVDSEYIQIEIPGRIVTTQKTTFIDDKLMHKRDLEKEEEHKTIKDKNYRAILYFRYVREGPNLEIGLN